MQANIASRPAFLPCPDLLCVGAAVLIFPYSSNSYMECMVAFSNLQPGFIFSHLEAQDQERFLCPSYSLSFQAFIAGNGLLTARHGGAMNQIPPMQNDASYCSSSQSEGDLREASDGLDPNADVQHRAMLRYERQLQSDPQLQVQSQTHQTQTCQQSAIFLPVLSIPFWCPTRLHQQTAALPTPSPAMLWHAPMRYMQGYACTVLQLKQEAMQAYCNFRPWQTHTCHAVLIFRERVSATCMSPCYAGARI